MAETLGPYELEMELGRGAMAVVWKAFDRNLEREIALKEPLIPIGMDSATAAEIAARFVREAKAAAKLNHPNIVTIYNAEIYSGRPAIAMELLEGQTLGDCIARRSLSLGSTTVILAQLLDAAGFAHQRGVVHRDIKPENVFVTDDGLVKLTDFGIAATQTSARLTQAGQVLGTPGYMAPEQVVGNEVDSRADIFAIGVIGYEMVTGRNPFGASDGVPATAILYRIVHEEPPSPTSIDPSVPPWLAAVLKRAMSKDPAHRYQSAAEMATDLRAQCPPSLPASLPLTTEAEGRGHVALWGAIAAVAVVAVTLGVVFSGGGAGGGTKANGGSATTTPSPPAVGTDGLVEVRAGVRVRLPKGWKQVTDPKLVEPARFRADGPTASSVFVFADGAPSKLTPWQRAQTDEKTAAGNTHDFPGYKLVKLEPRLVEKKSAGWWEYTYKLPSGAKMHRIDFYFRAPKTGYVTILAVRWPEAGSLTLKEDALSILTSLNAR